MSPAARVCGEWRCKELTPSVVQLCHAHRAVMWYMSKHTPWCLHTSRLASRTMFFEFFGVKIFCCVAVIKA